MGKITLHTNKVKIILYTLWFWDLRKIDIDIQFVNFPHKKNALQFLFKIFQKSIGFQNYQAEIKYVYDQKFTCSTIWSCHTSFYLSLAVDFFKLCAFEINCTKISVKR